ncbi:MAG: hypothetical protein ABEJ57_02645 [Halobacteriaceae archaeon]
MAGVDRTDTGQSGVGVLERYYALAAIVAVAVALSTVFVGVLQVVEMFERYVPNLLWLAGWFAVFFYVAWWTVFFWASEEGGDDDDTESRLQEWEDELLPRRIITLPTYLEYNTHRVGGADETELEAAIESLSSKAEGTISTVSAIVGFSLLIFSFTVNFLLTSQGVLSVVEQNVLMVIAFVQIVAIVAFLVGMDSLDTSTNTFVRMDITERYRVNRVYYRTGIYYYYRGLFILVFSAFLFTMIVNPLITVVGTAVFAWLGYDYWFGYADGRA